MIESKVGSNKVRNSKLSNTILSKKSSREKIMMLEKRSVILNKFKKNILKITMILLVLLIILIYTNSNKKINIDEYSNISKLSSIKYSSEIVNLYNRDGQLGIFLTEMNRVQSLVGIYVVSNSTLKENSFSELVKTLNKEINDGKWTNLNSKKSIYYNGRYTIDDSGNLKFKFDNKKIEPNWINNESISRYVILN